MLALLATGIGCRHKSASVVPAAPNDNDYIDLTAGERVSVNVPLLKSGGYVAKVDSVQESGTTLSVAIPDLIGFRVSTYSVQGRAKGRVTLKFESARSTSDGKPMMEKKAPVLPFEMPPGDRYIRLIFTLRSSLADHNMAIAAAKDAGTLNAFTQRLRADPKACGQSGAVFCSWVPTGIAVRPESQ
jgi:hypothetical protein